MRALHFILFATLRFSDSSLDWQSFGPGSWRNFFCSGLRASRLSIASISVTFSLSICGCTQSGACPASTKTFNNVWFPDGSLGFIDLRSVHVAVAQNLDIWLDSENVCECQTNLSGTTDSATADIQSCIHYGSSVTNNCGAMVGGWNYTVSGSALQICPVGSAACTTYH